MTVREVRLLKAKDAAVWRQLDGWINLTVPRVLDHEVVALSIDCTYTIGRAATAAGILKR
jgi:hypothetical protein